jgi:hypothetical protein
MAPMACSHEGTGHQAPRSLQGCWPPTPQSLPPASKAQPPREVSQYVLEEQLINSNLTSKSCHQKDWQRGGDLLQGSAEVQIPPLSTVWPVLSVHMQLSVFVLLHSGKLLHTLACWPAPAWLRHAPGLLSDQPGTQRVVPGRAGARGGW